jgi:hypothetical protein
MSKNSTIHNKKHVAHAEVVRRQSLAIQYVALAVIVIVVGLVAYGILSTTVLLQYRTVASVNGEKINMREFQGRVKLQRLQLLNQFNEYYQFAQMFGSQDPMSDPNFGGTLTQIYTQLESPEVVGQEVLDALVDERLILQEAEKRGITADPQDIEKAIQEQFSFFPNGTPTLAPTSTPFTLPPLNPTQLALVTITPTPAPATEVPSATPDLTSTPTTAPTATAEPTTGPTATAEPTATPYTLEGYQSSFAESMTNLKENTALSEEDYRAFFTAIYLREKLVEEITKDVRPVEEQFWAQHILVSTEETANEVLTRLNNGEDWGTLAAEYSQDGSAQNGGDLGWNSADIYVPEFKAALLAMQAGETSLQPVQSEFGWHIIRILGREERPVDDERFAAIKQTLFSAWLTELRTTANIQTFEIWREYVPTEPSLAQ